MPFKKGQSGNPSGRPKIVTDSGKTLRQLAREHTEEALETLLNVIRDVEASHTAKVSAAQQILDRGWGKPVQPVDGDGEGGAILGRVIFNGLNADG